MLTRALTRALTRPLTRALSGDTVAPPAIVLSNIVVSNITQTSATITATSSGSLVGGSFGIEEPGGLSSNVAGVASAQSITVDFASFGENPGDLISGWELYYNIVDAFPTDNPANRAGFVVVPDFNLASGDVTAPVISLLNVGTPTSTGLTGSNFTTDEANGTAYLAVVTDAGTATNAQIIAGTGGNIVTVLNQPVTATGVQTFADVTGLTASTNYELIGLHVDGSPNANESNQLTVGFTTAAATSTVLLAFNESGAEGTSVFTDQSPLSRTINSSGEIEWQALNAPAGLTTWGRFSKTFAAHAMSVPPLGGGWVFSGDFTIEATWRLIGAGSQLLINLDSGADGSYFIEAQFAGVMRFVKYAAAGRTTFMISNLLPTWTQNTTYNIAVTRQGNTYRGFVGGIKSFETINAAGIFNGYTVQPSLFIGNNEAGGGKLIGNIGSLRILDGVALYTTDYTPPTLPLVVV